MNGVISAGSSARLLAIAWIAGMAIVAGTPAARSESDCQGYGDKLPDPSPLIPGIYWNVVKTGESGDIVSVHVSLSEEPSCGEEDCGYNRTSELIVYPCPTDKPCIGDTLDLYVHQYLEIDMKLLKGVTYTFEGSCVHAGFYDSYEVPCKNSCWAGGDLTAVRYPDDFIATAETSWGAIKSLYDK